MEIKELWTRQTQFGGFTTYVKVSAQRVKSNQLPTIVFSNWSIGPRGGNTGANVAVGFTIKEWMEITEAISKELSSVQLSPTELLT